MRPHLPSLLLLLLISQTSYSQRKRNPEFFLSKLSKITEAILRSAQLEPHDTIANIGAAYGWTDVALGIQTDSLVFDLEDLDSADLNKNNLQMAYAAYTRVRGKPITNQYSIHYGTDTSTLLPTRRYNKVFLFDVFHHFTHQDTMIKDLHRILKPNGLLIVSELIARRSGEQYKACKRVIYTLPEIISAFEKNGFRLVGINKTVKSYGTKVRYFTFSVSKPN